MPSTSEVTYWCKTSCLPEYAGLVEDATCAGARKSKDICCRKCTGQMPPYAKQALDITKEDAGIMDYLNDFDAECQGWEAYKSQVPFITNWLSKVKSLKLKIPETPSQRSRSRARRSPRSRSLSQRSRSRAPPYRGHHAVVVEGPSPDFIADQLHSQRLAALRHASNHELLTEVLRRMTH